MAETPFHPEFPCPRCGYNVIIQVQRRLRRCSECGQKLPDIDPRNKVAWDIVTRQMRREIRGY